MTDWMLMPDGWFYYGPAESQYEAEQRLLEHHDFVAVDTETIALKGEKNVLDGDDRISLNAKTAIGIGIAIAVREAYYFPLGEGHKWKNVPACNTEVLEIKLARTDETKVFFNCIFDLDRIEDAIDIDCRPYADYSLMCRVQGLWNSLDENIGHLLGREHESIEIPKGQTMLDREYPSTAWKCCKDVMGTLEGFLQQNGPEWGKRVDAFSWTDWIGRSYDVNQGILESYRIDLHTTILLRKMSKRGIALRFDRVAFWEERLKSESLVYEHYFKEIGFNPGSLVEVGYTLALRGNYIPFTATEREIANGKRRQYKVDEDTLLDVGVKDPLAYLILEWRKRQRLLTGYINPAKEMERFITHFRLDLATARLASYERNVQNIPGSNYQGLRPVGGWNIRDILAPDDPSGEWYWMDYSQAEMRGFAYLSKDPVMLQEYLDKKNLHELQQQQIWPGTDKNSRPDLYTLAKAGNFQWIFDADAKTFARNTRQPVELCTQLKTAFMSKYHVGRAWMESQRHLTGSWVENQYGRRMRLPVDAVYLTQEHVDKCKINWPVQSLIADIVKRGMLYLDLIGAPLVMQVHDELVADGPWEWPMELTTIHPELYIPFEEHHGAYWE